MGSGHMVHNGQRRQGRIRADIAAPGAAPGRTGVDNAAGHGNEGANAMPAEIEEIFGAGRG